MKSQLTDIHCQVRFIKGIHWAYLTTKLTHEK